MFIVCCNVWLLFVGFFCDFWIDVYEYDVWFVYFFYDDVEVVE